MDAVGENEIDRDVATSLPAPTFAMPAAGSASGRQAIEKQKTRQK
jgi:hypothetical protein